MHSLNATLYEIVLRIEKNDQMSAIYYLEIASQTLHLSQNRKKW